MRCGIISLVEYGRLAQLVEHSLDVRVVTGSSPVTSTMKKHFFGSAFSMKRTLRCMKNEARLRLVKRGFAVLMVRALRFTFAGGKRFIAELYN